MSVRFAQSHCACGDARIAGGGIITEAQRSVSRRDFLKSASGLVVAIVFSPQVLAQGLNLIGRRRYRFNLRFLTEMGGRVGGSGKSQERALHSITF